MDELIGLVSQKSGIASEQAKKAVETVIAFLKDKIPGGLGGQIDQLLSGNPPEGLGNLAKGLGGMFGR